MLRVKEFYHQEFIDADINKWIEENPGVKIIDIKYSSSVEHSAALIIYEGAIANAK